MPTVTLEILHTHVRKTGHENLKTDQGFMAKSDAKDQRHIPRKAQSSTGKSHVLNFRKQPLAIPY